MARGWARVLVARLAELAERRRISTLVAQVLPEDRAILDVLHDRFGAHVKVV